MCHAMRHATARQYKIRNPAAEAAAEKKQRQRQQQHIQTGRQSLSGSVEAYRIVGASINVRSGKFYLDARFKAVWT